MVLYSSVDTTLKNAADNASDYVTRTMERSDSIQSNNSFSNSGKSKPSSNVASLSNVSVLLYDTNGKIVNAIDAFVPVRDISI